MEAEFLSFLSSLFSRYFTIVQIYFVANQKDKTLSSFVLVEKIQPHLCLV
jgi:hypothetical protein